MMDSVSTSNPLAPETGANAAGWPRFAATRAVHAGILNRTIVIMHTARKLCALCQGTCVAQLCMDHWNSCTSRAFLSTPYPQTMFLYRVSFITSLVEQPTTSVTQIDSSLQLGRLVLKLPISITSPSIGRGVKRHLNCYSLATQDVIS